MIVSLCVVCALGCERSTREVDSGAASPTSVAAASVDVELPDGCVKRATPVRYPAVEPIFAAHCGRCHNQRKSDNRDAQRVFESSSYPFSTERPDTLLEDLVGMFESRDGLSAEERCAALNWIAGGGLDASGRAPLWRSP